MPQNKISDHILPSLVLTDGLVSIFLAVFAYSLGFDPTPNWGNSRMIIFFIGLVLIGASIFLFTRKPLFTKSERAKSVMLFGHVWATIFVVYAFYITFGTFTTWKASTQYYTQLANAFGKGQLHVDVEPGQALLNVPDPYDPDTQRPFNDDVWDLSLYKGKLYLYWGPVPALLLTPIQLIASTKIIDMYLVYFFLCGLLVFNSLILLKLRQLFFPNIPMRNVVISTFLIGLILPILWSLNVPDVYEAAIGAGQFFLIGGIYFAILAFAGNIRKRYLFLTGLFWACSVGSRAINVFPILFLTTLTAFWIWKNRSKPVNRNTLIRLVASLLTPLALGAILIGWYNWARFDSPLEFGLRYQITIYNLNRDMPLTFQPDYFPLNFYAYLFQPFEFISNFPFIRPTEIYPLLDALNIAPPKLFAGGPVTGILFSMPFLLFALTPFFSKKNAENNTEDKLELKNFTLYLLGGSFLISFATILIYFYEQTRFILDMISQITLLAIIGYWMVLSNPRSSKVLLHAANVLIMITIVASILLSFTSEGNRMEKLNPALMEKINSFFTSQK